MSVNVFKDDSYVLWRKPLKWIEWKIRNIKYAWQRATKGYCDRDIWNMDYYLLEILPNMLTDLANTTHSYPYHLTPEEWDKQLRDTAALLYDCDESKWVNPYAKFLDHNYMTSDSEIRKAFCEEEIAYGNRRKEKMEKALTWIRDNFFDLWD